jgi:hypothetical protein
MEMPLFSETKSAASFFNGVDDKFTKPKLIFYSFNEFSVSNYEVNTKSSASLIGTRLYILGDQDKGYTIFLDILGEF